MQNALGLCQILYSSVLQIKIIKRPTC
uniref:Uncharacterized protein n=1 Tax=Anguilla anguilla TaxID=7936 RepID=A0A0E9QYT6_ANGAN